jgi:hypothetical protein
MSIRRWTFFLFLICMESLPSAALGQNSGTAQSSNYEDCLYGRSGCDSTKLTAEQKNAVAKAAHDRNYQNCLHERDGCDSSQLSAKEKDAVAQFRRQRSSARTSPSRQNGLSNDNYYTNSDGNRVHSPAYSNTVPSGATAQCRDGSYSFSQHHQGTCSHHGGVARWL